MMPLLTTFISKVDIIQPNGTIHSTKFDNASDAKDTDTKLSPVQGKPPVDGVHKNMKQSHALRKPANALTVVANTQRGIMSALSASKNTNG